MEDIRLKKLIVALTVFILLALWWNNRPHTIQAPEANLSFNFISKKSWGGGQTTPLIVALHGNGDTMRNFRKTLFHDLDIDARVIFIQGPYPYQGGHAWPRSGADLKRYGDALAEVVELFSQKYNTMSKPILLGFSGGGCMAYYQAAIYPERYSTIIPISGSLDSAFMEDVESVDDTAQIVAMHGISDELIRFANGRNAVDLLLDHGLNAEMIEMEGGHLAVFTSGHDQLKAVIDSAIAN